MKEQMDDFQVMRESIGQEYREVVERRVFTVTGNRLDEEEEVSRFSKMQFRSRGEPRYWILLLRYRSGMML